MQQDRSPFPQLAGSDKANEWDANAPEQHATESAIQINLNPTLLLQPIKRCSSVMSFRMSTL